jgi:hypothetical protein
MDDDLDRKAAILLANGLDTGIDRVDAVVVGNANRDHGGHVGFACQRDAGRGQLGVAGEWFRGENPPSGSRA